MAHTNEDKARQDADEGRLRELAALLGDLARLMAEQAEFHSGARMSFGVEVVREAAEHAERRLTRLAIAGARWRREMEKSMLSEIARGAVVAQAILDEAGGDAWPDLARAAAQAVEALRAAARRDRSLFAAAGAPDDGTPAGFPELPGWRLLDHDCFAALRGDGVPMGVVPWGVRGERRWLAQVGGIGVGLHATAEAAARHADAVHAAWFADLAAPA